MEAHECIFDCVCSVLTLDVCIIDILWNSVVDVEESYCIVRNYSTNELRETSVDMPYTPFGLYGVL